MPTADHSHLLVRDPSTLKRCVDAALSHASGETVDSCARMGETRHRNG